MAQPVCWVVEQGLAAAGSCSGRLIRAHLIPKQRIKRELRDIARDRVRRRRRAEGWRKPDVVPKSALRDELERLVWDARTWVPVCGGAMGNAGHHGAVDAGGVGKIVIPRAKLPAGLEEYAAEYGLEWSLEADYGLKESGC